MFWKQVMSHFRPAERTRDRVEDGILRLIPDMDYRDPVTRESYTRKIQEAEKLRIDHKLVIKPLITEKQ